MPNAAIMVLPDHGPNRSILLVDGAPARVGLAGRLSTSAHGRLKVAFVTPTDAGPAVLGPEFRLEMN